VATEGHPHRAGALNRGTNAVRILWLKSELLHPTDKGGRIRSYQMLKHLKRDHEVTYLAPSAADDRDSLHRASEYCHRIVTVPWREAPRFSPRFYKGLARNLLSPLPYAIEKYRCRAMTEQIGRELRRESYDAVVCDFLVPSINIPRSVASASVLFQHNVESIIWRRHYETQSGTLRRAYFRNQWQKMLSYESSACRRFDAVVAVSTPDRDFIREHYEVSEVYEVPTGVDTEYFRPLEGNRRPCELVFTGSMDWMPNEDAILHFVDRILPLIAQSFPNVRLTVAGRSPGPRLQSLSRSNPRVRITGCVEDIRPYIAQAAVCIVPLRIGGGTRLKIYEAMAMGKPVVSTSIGAEGLPLLDGKDLLIADDAEQFANAVIRLLRDPDTGAKLGRHGRSVVSERFGWQRAATLFAEICEHAAHKQARVRAA
jgi:sugar transferase (PEP-CTERM/EpsH1 system associated)